MTLELAPTSPKITYDEAILYCFLCTYNNHRDWRMPTYEEYRINENRHWGWFRERHQSASLRIVTPVRTNHDS